MAPKLLNSKESFSWQKCVPWHRDGSWLDTDLTLSSITHSQVTQVSIWIAISSDSWAVDECVIFLEVAVAFSSQFHLGRLDCALSPLNDQRKLSVNL